MAVEIERKFLLKNENWRNSVSRSTVMAQCYLNQVANTVRVRIAGDKAFLTIKGKTKGISRLEFEYEIPVSDARQLMQLSQTPVVEKTRHYVESDGHVWEIDEFSGLNKGLVVAEIELKSEDEAFSKPDWVGMDVTDDKRYRNSHLASNPFVNW